MIQFTAAQAKDVENWFNDYRQVLRKLNIKHKKNIINFDEVGFRVGCMKEHEILVPLDIKKVRSFSSKILIQMAN